MIAAPLPLEAQQGKARKRSPFTRPAFLLALLLCFLALQEICLRLIFPLPEVMGINRLRYTNNSATPALKKQKELSHVSFIYPSEPDGFAFRHDLNLYGFRDGEWKVEKPGGEERIMLVGDSIVEGFGAPEEKSIPALLKKRLSESGASIRVMNAGAGTMQVPNCFALIRDLLPVFRPDSLILVLYFNDLPPPPYDPAWLERDDAPARQSPWTPRIVSVIGRALRGEPVPRAWSEGPFPFYAAVPDPANWWSDKEVALRWGPFVRPDIRRAMEQGLFNPYIAGDAARAIEHFDRDFDLRPHLKALAEYAARFSTRLFIAFVPSKLAVSEAYSPYLGEMVEVNVDQRKMGEVFRRQGPALEKACRDLGLPFLDLGPALRAREEKGERMYWSYDFHLNPAGYEAAARSLAGWWLDKEKGRASGG